VITEKQRRRALARAKWERQQARRTAAQRRQRTVSVIVGAALTVVVILFVGWGVHALVTDDSNSPNAPAVTYKTPTNPGFTTIYSPPTTTGAATTGKPTGTETNGATTDATKPSATTPATTGTTR
jgi:peptidyl-prolyl cis-trans isomerase B (cyclophilin B)